MSNWTRSDRVGAVLPNDCSDERMAINGDLRRNDVAGAKNMTRATDRLSRRWGMIIGTRFLVIDLSMVVCRNSYRMQS